MINMNLGEHVMSISLQWPVGMVSAQRFRCVGQFCSSCSTVLGDVPQRHTAE